MSIAYKRILLKLSGEVLAGEAGKGIDNDTVLKICKSVKKVAETFGAAEHRNIWTEQEPTTSACLQLP